MKNRTINPSRDPRIEDPTNLWLIDPLAGLVLPLAVRCRVSANAVSITGLAIGGAAALGYSRWFHPGWAVCAFLLSMVWLVADSLDGMIARATRTTSAFGRELDGLCDHGVFTFLYIGLGAAVDTKAGWVLTATACIAHAVQSNLYEAERTRFHRRVRGETAAEPPPPSRNPAVRLYHAVAASMDHASAPFDRFFAASDAPHALGRAYGEAAVPVFRAMVPLSQNIRVLAIFLACLCHDVAFFWWFEIVPLTILSIATLAWHRAVEAKFVATQATSVRARNI